MMVTSASVIPHSKSGELRALAVISTKRVPQLHDVPTMLELGYPDLTLGPWQGIYAPQKMPQAIVKKLFADIHKVMTHAWVVDRLNGGGAIPVTSKSPEDFAAFTKAQKEFWAKIIKETGATAE